MATLLEQFPKKVHRGGAKCKYPYSKWLDGNIWELKRPLDFTCEIETMKTNLFYKCRNHGLRCKTQKNEAAGTLCIKAYRPSK